MRVQPLTGVLGAEITDVDLAKELDGPGIGDLAKEITEALDEYLVIVIPEQSLSPGQQTDFTHHLGPPAETPFVGTMPGYPEVIKVVKEAEEKDAFNFGGAWHSDFSFQQTPPSYTLLHAIDVPPYGGDTVWTSNIAALDRLGPDMRASIDLPDAFGVHTAKDAYSPKLQALHDGLKHMDIRTSESANQQTLHPVITRHPGNNKEVLFFNAAYCRSLQGTEVEDAAIPAFLWRLHQHCTDHQLTFRHRWRNGDLAIWDNRATQHLAVNDYGGFRRELHRTTVRGEAPVRATA